MWVCAALGGCAFDTAGLAGGADEPAVDADGLPERPDAADLPGAVDAGAPVPALDAGPPDASVPSEKLLSCPRATPVLDGNLIEWGSPLLGYAMAEAAERIEVTDGYTNSAALSFRCAHDDKYLYVAYTISDDEVSAGTFDELYEDDSVTFYLDARGDASGPFGADDHEIYFRPSGAPNVRDYGPAGPSLKVVGAIWPTGPGYVVEVGLEKATLGVVGPLPAIMGVNLGLADEDTDFLSTDFAYGVWYMASRPTCATCCDDWGATRPWCDTTTFALLRLE